MEKEKNNIISLLVNEGIDTILKFITLASMLFMSYNEAVNYFYSIEAKFFYHIPQFYFYSNSMFELLFKIIYILIVFIILYSPLSLKWLFKKNKFNVFESLFLSFYSACFIFMIFLIPFFEFMINILHFGINHIEILFCFYVFITIIIGVIFCLVFRTDFDKTTNKNEQIIHNDKNQKYTISFKTREDKVFLLYMIFVIIFSILFFVKIFYTLSSSSPENKKDYEIIVDANEEYNVIVGYYNNLAILMPGKIKYDASEKSTYLEIEGGKYKLEFNDNKIIQYRKFRQVFCDLK